MSIARLCGLAALWWCVALPTLAASPPAPAEPASTVTVKDGRLSIRVADRPLEWVLEEVSREAKVAISGAAGRRLVSMQFQDLPVDEGLRRLLGSHDAFFFYGVEGKEPAALRAVWIFPKGRGRGLEPVPPESWASTRELEGDLTDASPLVRARAIEALLERAGDHARDAAVEALKDPDERVRTGALYEALTAGVELPADALADLAKADPSADVRFLALDALADREEARPSAEAALDDPSPHVRRKAQEILRALAPARPRPDPRPRGQ